MSNSGHIHLEILQKRGSTLPKDVIQSKVLHMLFNKERFPIDCNVSDFEDSELEEHVESVRICDFSGDIFHHSEHNILKVTKDNTVKCHIFQLNYDGPDMEELSSADIPTASEWFLPCFEFHGMWENLIYDSSIKSQLLSYISTSLVFAKHMVDPQVIAWNKVVLLHGPPGTGKTSLCKALAQKISIRVSEQFKYSIMIEINSHSLFSKWFSESGKLVMKMFQKIEEYVAEENTLVFVLIDEVESIAHARKATIGGNDPSDAIRVVNALLTQVDRLKRYPNVVILTTSNITGTIDLAFVDRADIKQLIGLPSTEAIYQIYQSCIKELNRVGMIYPKLIVVTNNKKEASKIPQHCKLMEIARASQGLSGRTLRKLPFLAFALFLKDQQADPDEFLSALMKTVWKQFEDQELISRG